MRNFIIAFVAIVVVAAGYYLWRNPLVSEMVEEAVDAAPNSVATDNSGIPPGATMEDGTIPEPVATITYTESGYSPSTVTIKRGDTVRFVNGATSDETWPASAVHPTHSIYPEKTSNDCLGSAFDACRGLKPGEFWDFTFSETGTWRFHDHLHASKTGSVTVE